MELEFALKNKHKKAIVEFYKLLPVPNIEAGKTDSYINVNVERHTGVDDDIIKKKANLYHVRSELTPSWSGYLFWLWK